VDVGDDGYAHGVRQILTYLAAAAMGSAGRR
jgi:hypothetical protein